MAFDSYVSCVDIIEHRTPLIVIGQNPFMDWGSIPFENILLYNFDVLASFELVIMVMWNVDQLLIVLKNDKIKNVVNSRHTSCQFSRSIINIVYLEFHLK